MPFNNSVNANSAGFQSLSTTGVWAGRTLQQGTGITITNADGIAGDPTISASGSGTTITSVKVTLTNAQLRDWVATPVELVAAPGAGKIILALQVNARLNYGGTNPFTGGGGGVFVGLGVSGGPLFINMGATWTASANVFFYGGCPTYLGSGANIEVSNPDTNAVNQHLQVKSNGNMTGNAANDNTISFYITYMIITI